MKNQKRKLRKQSRLLYHQKRIKYLTINLTKEAKACTLKIIKHCGNKLKKTKINGKTSYIHGLEDLILLKFP